MASCWLARLQEGDRVPCFLRHSTFKLPRDPATPVGGGCLPMLMLPWWLSQRDAGLGCTVVY